MLMLQYIAFLIYSVFAWVVALVIAVASNSAFGAFAVAAGVGLTYVFQAMEAHELRKRWPAWAPVQAILLICIIALWIVSIISSLT